MATLFELQDTTIRHVVIVVRKSGESDHAEFLETSEKKFLEVALYHGIRITTHGVSGIVKSNIMPHLDNDQNEEICRSPETANSLWSKNMDRTAQIQYGYAVSFTRAINEALFKQSAHPNSHPAILLAGIDGLSTSWTRLVHFCGENDAF